MMHKGQELERKAKALEEQANNELDEKRRIQLRSLAADLRQQKRSWEQPH